MEFQFCDDADTGSANLISNESKHSIAAGTLAVSSNEPNSCGLDLDSLRADDIACLNSIESNQLKPAGDPAIIDGSSLVNFCESRNIFVDESRREFLERNDVKISRLVSGRLYNRNRYRELLLGVKAVGKTALLQTILVYVQNKYPNVLAIYENFHACDLKLSSLIYEKIMRCCNLSRTESENLDSILQLRHTQRILELEDFLVAKDIYVLLLLDEFQNVYSLPAEIGKPIVNELSILTGTTKGRIHCVVTGSSSELRVLAFTRLKAAEVSNYPSYQRGVDLNSTKLQPFWILPVNRAIDFRRMCSIIHGNITDDELVERYIYSGGRPGLAAEETYNIDHIPYSLTTKYLLLGDSIEATILQCLFDCMNSYNITNPNEEVVDPLEIMQNELAAVPITVLYPYVMEKASTLTSKLFEEALFNLADAGQLVMAPTYNGTDIYICGTYIYFQLKTSRYSKLTWKEAAALKMPQGLFCDLAEDVAMRFIAQKSERLFKLKLAYHGKSILNFCDKKDTIRRHNGSVKVFDFARGSDVELKDIVNILHKEHYKNEDCCGADGIILSPGTSNNRSVHLVRVQLKLGQGFFEPEEVKSIELEMKNKGKRIVDIIKTEFDINSYTNYLITTKYPKQSEGKSEVANDENNKQATQQGGVDVEELQVEFKVIGPKALDDVWPEEVKTLGKPYGSNRNFR